MLTQEFNTKLASAELNFTDRAYEDMVKTVHAMNLCPCGNLQALWMFALNSYNPITGSSNALTERHLHALFCRMKADGSGNAVISPTPPVTPPPTAVFAADLLWTDEDPFPFLTESPFPEYPSYNTTISLPEGSPVTLPLTGMPEQHYLVIRYPDTEGAKAAWYHDIYNYGTIPDFVFREIFSARGSLYIMTRNPVTFDPAKTLKFT